jgi:hypothetical protein
MLEIAITLIVGFALGFGVREWAFNTGRMGGAFVSRPDAPARATWRRAGNRARPANDDYPHFLLNEPRAVVALQVTLCR